jgi:hypothetical protein
MNTKLILTIEESLIEKAKLYAKGKGRSLSDKVESYFKVIITQETTVVITPHQLPPLCEDHSTRIM